MRDVINGQVVEWGNKVWVLPGTESRSRLGARRPAGITDIPIAFTDIREAHGDHDPHAIIECERIAGSRTDLCRLYVVEGIDRFKTAKYAGNHVFGFMAGYILSGDPPSATHGINRYLTTKGRQDERLRPCLIRDEPWTRSSTQDQLARRSGLSNGFLSDEENSKRNIGSQSLLQIANVLGASVDYLLQGEARMSLDREPIVIPPELGRAAEELGLSYASTVELLEAQQSVIARRRSQGVRRLSVEDWKRLHEAIKKVFG